MEHADQAPRFRSDLLRDAVVTLAAVVVALLALDDITTDTAPSFAFERLGLAGCALWFIFVASRLLRRRRWVLGSLSLGLVAIAALAQPTIGPGTVPSMRFEYIATVAALAWFVVLAGVLAGRAWRTGKRYAA